MSWQQLELQLPASQLPQAEALLSLLGAASVTLAGAGRDEILEPEPGSAPVWPVTRVRALFPIDFDLSSATRVLAQSLGADILIQTSTLADAEWTDTLTEVPREIAIGSRLLITGVLGAVACADRTVVRLRRGLGFGTGDHPTTRLCLEWLEAELQAGATVIDYGCGSGILAVTALRLGADYAWAVDIEPQAIAATTATAELNDVADRLWVGYPANLPSASADIILANILARPLLGLADQLAAHAGRSGTVVLTGILAEQYAEVSAAYAGYFSTLARRDRDGWVCIVASMPRR